MFYYEEDFQVDLNFDCVNSSKFLKVMFSSLSGFRPVKFDTFEICDVFLVKICFICTTCFLEGLDMKYSTYSMKLITCIYCKAGHPAVNYKFKAVL